MKGIQYTTGEILAVHRIRYLCDTAQRIEVHRGREDIADITTKAVVLQTIAAVKGKGRVIARRRPIVAVKKIPHRSLYHQVVLRQQLGIEPSIQTRGLIAVTALVVLTVKQARIDAPIGLYKKERIVKRTGKIVTTRLLCRRRIVIRKIGIAKTSGYCMLIGIARKIEGRRYSRR